MTITTASVNTVKVGQTILKRISDGDYYGEVAAIERVNPSTVRITYTDGEVQTKYGTIIVKEV